MWQCFELLVIVYQNKILLLYITHFSNLIFHSLSLLVFSQFYPLQQIRLIQKTAICVKSVASYRSHSAPLIRKQNVQLIDDYVAHCKLVFMIKMYRNKLECVSSLNAYFYLL